MAKPEVSEQADRHTRCWQIHPFSSLGHSVFSLFVTSFIISFFCFSIALSLAVILSQEKKVTNFLPFYIVWVWTTSCSKFRLKMSQDELIRRVDFTFVIICTWDEMLQRSRNISKYILWRVVEILWTINKLIYCLRLIFLFNLLNLQVEST